MTSPGVGVTEPILSVPPFSHFFPNTGCLYNIAFIFEGCHRIWAAETLDKYDVIWYITYTFAQFKVPVTEKLINGDLVTPTPGLFCVHDLNQVLILLPKT